MATTAGPLPEPHRESAARARFDTACVEASIPWMDRELLWRLHRSDARRAGWALEVLVAEHADWTRFRAAIQGDERAAAEFHSRWTRYVRAYCGGRFPVDQRAEIASSFFERTWRLVPDAFHWQCPFGVYLRAILVNTSRDVGSRARTRKAREASLDEAEDLPSLVARSDDELLRQERHAGVRRALAGLGESDRRLVVATLVEARSGDDVARELGITRAAVHQRLHRARVKLRALLALEGETR